MKKFISALVATAMIALTLAGCGGSFDAKGDITVISREEGSGTRGAFIELFGVEKKDDTGTKVDYTIETADTTNSTQVMITSVSDNTQAIGYISLGALNDTVKAVSIDGVAATVENIKNGTYSIARPFNIATLGEQSEVTKDFIAYILSADGQKVIDDNGYISVDATASYTSTQPSGTLTIAGSSSVTPVMEKLVEAYKKVNPNATIELQQSDSTTGMNSAAEGVCDIGMASRELKDSELAKGLTPVTIAIDGIAVIVNKKNTTDNLTTEDVMKIYTGEITNWSEIQ
jgi:phosphate transport system substrate-binding protein